MTITVQSNDAAADAQVNKPAESPATAPKEKNQSEPVADEAAEQNETAESGTVEIEEEEGEEPEVEESETETETKGADEADKPRKKSGSQRRKERAERAEAEVERLQGLMEQLALKGAGDSKPDPKIDPKKAADDGKPDPAKFDTHAEYVEALTDWKLDQRDKKEEAKKLQAKFQEVVKTHAERIDAFKEKHDDFDDVLKNLKNVPNSPAVREIVTTSENGPEILYELAKNPAEAKRIALLPPLAAAREIGKIETRLASESSAEKKTETKRVSSAPKPIAPVGGGGKASAPPKTLEEAAGRSYAEYKKIREEQLKKQRRRA